MEQTLVVLKPDAIKRGLVGEIIARFERVGLKIIGMKMVNASGEVLRKHYDKDEAWFKRVGESSLAFWEDNGKDLGEDLGTTDPVEIGKKIQGWLFEYLQSGPVLAFVLGGPNAVEIVRKHVGSTYPVESAPGTIRGDYHFDSPGLSAFNKRSVYNLVHCSGTPEEAGFEIKLWFRESEIHDYKRAGE